VVLVEDAAQTWVSANVKLIDLGWVGDRLWQWFTPADSACRA
jgi:hypothetical protein